MQNLFNDLKNALKRDERVFVDGKILKNKLTELALKFDDQLLSLLLENKGLKEQFFIDKKIKEKDVFLFNKDEFIKFINNKEFLPDSFTAFKNQIGLKNDEGYLKDSNEVVLVWPFKDCVLEGGQEKEDDGRNEIFYNETLAPDEVSRLFDKKVLSNFRKFDSKNIKNGIKEFDIIANDNLVVKGNNLLVLHSLKEKFRNKVKLIYIDPPYNTGGDSFKYNDKFNHSSWLTFMKNRLEVSKELLSEDGLIFVQIDDNEFAHLKLLMDEIYENQNFIQIVEIKANVGAANEYQNPFMPKNCEYGLIYSKNKKNYKYKPTWIKSDVDRAYNKIVINPRETNFKKWKIAGINEILEKKLGKKYSEKEVYEFYIQNANNIFQTISPKGVGSGLKKAMSESVGKKWSIYKREEKDDIMCFDGRMVRFYSKNLGLIDNEKCFVRELGSLWTDIAWMGIAKEGGIELKKGKKPEKLLKRIINLSTEKGDLVLDFFAGSGTTCAVAHKMGRRYIGIEQMDYIHDLPEARLKNVINGDSSGISKDKDINWTGGGSFVYAELKEWNEKYIADIQKAKSDSQLISIYKEMRKEAFFRYEIEKNKFEESEFKKLTIPERKEILLKCIDKNHLYVNYDEINDKEYGISEEDKKMNNRFYGK
jgi:adenine-specific DNA-methyltransferase